VKFAPILVIDDIAPFIHPERKFMHLGFHIFDLGFQSPDAEAAKPIVYATALLLIIVVVTLNLAAILLRNRIRKRFATSSF
jgi:phosphate transport system permease protein